MNNMMMCSNCHKRLAVVFVTRIENGERVSRGLCVKCAKEMGAPVDSMLGDVYGKLGITPEQLENMESELVDYLNTQTPSDSDDNEDGGAPAIDLPAIMRDFGLMQNPDASDATDHTPAQENDLPAKQTPASRVPGANSKQNEKKKTYKILDTYCRNLTAYAKAGKLDRIVGRERELSRMIQILCRRQKNNPCLIGEPGVGKTAIAEALAIRTASGDVPYKLRGKQIYLVDMTALVAGTQFRGQFESRMIGLINDVKEAGNVILVIDEIHNIVGTGEAEGSVNAANILKPALSRGEVQIIGATTLNEYRKYIEKDSALERRFQPITVNEPSVEETVDMLRGIKHYYEEYHKIHIPDAVLRRAATLSERYITDRYLPDKAIDLLDEAAAEVSLSSAALNESYEVHDELLQLKSERESLEGNIPTEEKEQQMAYERIADIRAREMKLSERLDTLNKDCEAVTMTAADLAAVVEIWTGIPATSIDENEFEQIDHLEENLRKHIVGQGVAVNAVARAIKRNRVGISYKKKPVSFIFAGPTGVGKTELVKALASELFHSPETLIRLDMSEFMEKHSVSRLIGSPPGYVGYDDAGQLTEKIRRKPYSIILFDEIEKAHPDVLNVLLQILDDGRVTDAQGKTVNFENTLIVMTTNAGSDRSAATAGFHATEEEASDERTQRALAQFLRPEFINRVDEVVTFRSLDKNDFVRIADIMLGQLCEVLEEKEIKLIIGDGVPAYVAEKSYSHRFGARNMRRFIQKEIEDRLAAALIADYDKHCSVAKIMLDDGGNLQVVCM